MMFYRATLARHKVCNERGWQEYPGGPVKGLPSSPMPWYKGVMQITPAVEAG